MIIQFSIRQYTMLIPLMDIKPNIHKNFISENLYSQVDGDGYNHRILYEIVGHRKTDYAILMETGYYEARTGFKRRVITTKGWKIKVIWDSGNTSYINIENIKETNPVEIAEYTKSNNIDKEPAFAWWVPSYFKRRNVIISKSAMRVRNNTKLVISIPATYDEDVELDRINGNKYWQDDNNK